ncbi:MAG: heme exporter protein CcmD [Pseudoxanthomonas sp.]
MTYLNYVIGAYAVFAIVMLWDFVAPHLHIRRELRAARLRKARAEKPSPSVELTR